MYRLDMVRIDNKINDIYSIYHIIIDFTNHHANLIQAIQV